MPLPADTDASTPKYLRDKYAIVGVGETTYTRGSGITTRALGTWAVRNAIADAGLKPADVDGMLSYQGGDSTFSPFIAGDLGIRLNFYMDVFGGGSSTEALIGIAIGVIEAGMCKMRGDLPRHERLLPGPHRRHRRARRGAGLGRHAAQPRLRLAERGPDVRPTFMRHMYDYGTTPEQVATVKVDPQRARLEQPEGLLQEARDGGRRAGQPHHLQAAASARLLRRDRQRHGHHRHHAPTARATAPPAGADPRRGRPLQQAAHRHALPARADLDASPASTRARSCGPTAGVGPGGHRRHRLLRRLHLHHHAAARGLRLLQEGRGRRTTSATAPSGSAASGPTTPAAGICARATRTA